MKKDKQLKDVNVTFRMNSKDYQDLIDIAALRQETDGVKMTVSKLITLSIEPYLLKKKIDNVIDAVEGSDENDIRRLMASKTLLEFYLGELEKQKQELKSRIDNIVLGKMIIQMQKKDGPVMSAPVNVKRKKKELQEA